MPFRNQSYVSVSVENKMLKKLSHARGTTTGPEMSANVWAAPATMSNARAIDRDFVSRQQFNALREPQLSASSRTLCRARSTRWRYCFR